MSALDAALRLAAAGLLAFPVNANKVPTCPGGFTDATTDATALRELWRLYPGPLVGIRTGAPSGLDCLDLDTSRHPEAEAWLAQHRDRIPATRVHRSRSGGLHYWFVHNVGLRCSTSRVSVGIDVKGDGGCATWWPATIPGAVLSRGPLAPWPAWLLDLAKPAPPTLPSERPTLPANAGQRARYIEAAMRGEIVAVASAPEGARNNTLNRATYSLCRFVVSGEVAAADVAEAMAHAALAAGLTAREAATTIASALRAGGAA